MSKKVKYIIISIISVIILLFTYNNDFLYKKDILKITNIETIKEEILTNNLGYQEKHKIQKIDGVFTNGKKINDKYSVEYEETYSSIITEKYRVGDKVFIVNENIDGLKRDFYITLIVIIFSISLCIIGKKQGVYSLINVIVNSIIFYLGLNLYKAGLNLVLLVIIEAIIFTVFSLTLVTGRNSKSRCSIISTLSTLFILFILLIFVRLFGFSNMNFNGLSYLTVPPEDVYFASLLIGGLGAIMDVSITITSSISELIDKNKNITRQELIKSSKEIGNDIMSTMISVIFFTYLSGELPLMVLALRNGISLPNFIMANFSLEMTRFLIGAISIALGILVSTHISINYFRKEKQND